MRRFLTLAFAFLTLQLSNEFPPLGIIDFYGLRSVSEAQVLEVLPYHVGNTIRIEQLQSQKHAVEEKLTSIPGVVRASLTLVCCANGGASEGKSILYVGVEETDSRCPEFEPAPTGGVRPNTLPAFYRKELIAAEQQSRGAPTNVITLDYLDGFFTALTAGNSFAVSNVLDGTNWPGAAVGQSSLFSDQINSLIASNRLLWVFGGKRAVCYYNAGTFPFPMQWRVVASSRWGCGAEQSRVHPFRGQSLRSSVG